MNLQLQQSNALMKSNVCFYAVLDRQGNLRSANDLFLKNFSSIISFHDLLLPADKERFSTILRAVTENPNNINSIDASLITRAGYPIATTWEFFAVGQNGQFSIECLGLLTTVVKELATSPADVHPGFGVKDTAEHSTEAIASNNPDRYKLLFNNNPLPMWIYNLATLDFIEVNDAAIAHYGYTRDEFLCMTIKDIRPLIDQENFIELRKSFANSFVHRGFWRHQKKDGQVIDVQITANPIMYDGLPAKLVLAYDITEQRRAEQKLIQSNERYNYAIKATFDAIWEWDLTQNKIYWGDGYKMLFGYEIDKEGELSMWYDRIHPDDVERVQSGIYKDVNSNTNSWTDEYKYLKANGSYANVVDRGIIIRDGHGKALRMIGAMQDITLRKANEEQLKQINLQLIRQQKERELTASILRSLTEKELLNEALSDILRKLTLFFNFEIGEVWLLNIDRNRIELREKWCANNEVEAFYTMHANVTYKLREKNQLGNEWNENEIKFIDNLPAYETFIRKEGALALGLTKSLGVPIIFKEQTIAVFSFFGKKDFFDRDRMKLYFEALSLQLGIDIQRKKTEEELNKFFELSPDILSIIGFDGKFKKVNAAFSKILGFTPAEVTKKSFEELVYPDDEQITREQFRQLEQGNTIHHFENRFRTKNGDYRWLAWASAPLADDRVVYATAKDITERKQLDGKLNRILESISDGFLTVDKDGIILYWNQQAEKILQLRRENVLGKNIFETFDEVVPKRFLAEFNKAFSRHATVHFEEFVPSLDSWFEISAYPYEGILSVFFRNVTDRKKSDEMVRVSNEKYEVLAKATKDTIWDWNLPAHEITFNEGLKSSFGYQDFTTPRTQIWGSSRIHPEDQERIAQQIHKQFEERQSHWEAQYRFECADGTYKHIFERGFTLYNNNHEPVRMIGSMQDLTETKTNELKLKELNQSLEKRAGQLAASNAELERFAYIASHDLQEPLRMVSSFLQLIGRKYKDKLDDKGHEYIGYAVDGAERMKGLILDLLEYSRVNSRKEKKEEVDLNEVATSLQHLYDDVISEVGGKLVIDHLPVVIGSRSQLTRLFQNLVGNALKYRRTIPPEIRITVSESDKHFQFAVADNGIGIEPRFFEKIFIIFQRLHNKNEYSGTGIGLAICKKIIDLHGGNIWVDSEPGSGSTFYFTLPKFYRSSHVMGITT